MESALTVKGQATIPKAIREHLQLKPGDRVKFFVHPDGSVVLTAETSGGGFTRHPQIEAQPARDNRRDD